MGDLGVVTDPFMGTYSGLVSVHLGFLEDYLQVDGFKYRLVYPDKVR